MLEVQSSGILTRHIEPLINMQVDTVYNSDFQMHNSRTTDRGQDLKERESF